MSVVNIKVAGEERCTAGVLQLQGVGALARLIAGTARQRDPVEGLDHGHQAIGDLAGTDSIEILKGIKSGEIVAISGVSRLREGMQVSDLSKMEGYKR